MPQFDESLQSFALLLLAELGSKFFNLVLGQSIDLALQTFERLKQRIGDLKGSVREDEICLTYMETLNKLRDCYE
jgi:enamine deaminase RidA (YjgF/YER057c/UK114 family)